MSAQRFRLCFKQHEAESQNETADSVEANATETAENAPHEDISSIISRGNGRVVIYEIYEQVVGPNSSRDSRSDS